MDVYRISRSHGPELVFEGACITTASGSPDDKVAPGRWHEVNLYRRSDDAWVAGIHYRSRHDDERDHIEAEVVDNASEIESVLLSYEPPEHLNRRLLSRLPSDERRRISSRVWTNYLDLVNRVMDDIAPHLSSAGSKADESTLPKEQDTAGHTFKNPE